MNEKATLFGVLLLRITAILAFSQDGSWSPWSKLETPCQHSENNSALIACGGGVRIRYRSCTNPVPQGPLGQPCQGSDFTYEPCNTHPCVLPEDFMWSEWSQCSKSCGKGFMTRHSMCGNLRSKHSHLQKLIENGSNDSTEDETVGTTESSDETTTLEADISTSDGKLEAGITGLI